MKKFLLPVLLLAACGGREPEVTTLSGYRDRSVPIASKAIFDPAEFAGAWRIIADFPQKGVPDCDRAISVSDTAILTGCVGGHAFAEGKARYLGQGRYEVDGQPFWVLWLAHDGEAAVVGRPDGTMGAILARDGISADRYKAATEMLDFNGYGLAHLVRR